MSKQKYEMKTERSQKMNEEGLLQLSGTVLAPYMQLSTALIGKARHAGDFFKFFHFFRSFLDLPPTVTFRIKVTKAL